MIIPAYSLNLQLLIRLLLHFLKFSIKLHLPDGTSKQHFLKQTNQPLK